MTEKNLEDMSKTDGPFITKKYEIREKDRLAWDKEKENERNLSEKLGKEEVSRLKSLGEQGVKILLDKLIDVTPKYNSEHKNWDYVGDILDYVSNRKYDWLIDYQKKASKKCHSRIKILGIDFTNLYNKLRSK